MQTVILSSLKSINPDDWNSLSIGNNPFLSHQFLIALERNDCLEPFGWYPQIVLAYDNDNLVGAAPVYIKTNSYGEFVFDNAWAAAYDTRGLTYYPKLVCTTPYTPAKGPRLLTRAKNQTKEKSIKKMLLDRILQLCKEHNFSSTHWLFCDQADSDVLQAQGLLKKEDCQYHWQNKNYQSFEHFLSTLTSSKRKMIKRERRRVREAGVTVRIITGDELSEEHLNTAHKFYADIYNRKYGVPTLNASFFQEIGKTMKQQLLLIFAYKEETVIAGSILFRCDDVLYGRFWGCDEYVEHLHFELCYYAGIEYCIEHGISVFEPGAQGEHKISRGFLPVKTTSFHSIENPEFNDLIKRHLNLERKAIDEQYIALTKHSPYRNTAD